MVSLYTAEKVSKTTLEFFPVELHPKALRMEHRVDGELKGEGLVRRVSIETFLEAGHNLVDVFVGPDEDDEPLPRPSLPLTALYWPVPKPMLEKAEGTRRGDPDLFDLIEGWQARLDQPDNVLIHKSGWDHSVWGIDGNEILMPIELEVWGTRFDLKQVELHLVGHPALVDFEIVKNPVYRNHEISGSHTGRLIVDPRKFDRSKLPEVVTRSWLQHEVVDGYSDKENDLLGLAALRRPY